MGESPFAVTHEWIARFTGLGQASVDTFFSPARRFPFAEWKGAIYPGAAERAECVLFLLETERLLELTFDEEGRMADTRVHPDWGRPSDTESA